MELTIDRGDLIITSLIKQPDNWSLLSLLDGLITLHYVGNSGNPPSGDNMMLVFTPDGLLAQELVSLEYTEELNLKLQPIILTFISTYKLKEGLNDRND